MADIKEVRSDLKKYKEHYKKCRSDNPFALAYVPLREFGFFILLFAAAYLCLYFAIFDGASMTSGGRIACATVGICIATVTLAFIFLRKIYRYHKFLKYSGYPTPVYKGKGWKCPCCKTQNNTLSPCKVCGIYPELYKSNEPAPQKIKYERRSKKLEKQFKDYKPVFKEEE